MNEWKENFKAKQGREWEFQNSGFEEEYIKFVEEREHKDEIHRLDLNNWKTALAEHRRDALE
jgi:hypothetical protein